MACKRIFDASMLRVTKIRIGLTIKFLVIFMNFHTMRKDVNSKQESSLSNSIKYLKILILFLSFTMIWQQNEKKKKKENAIVVPKNSRFGIWNCDVRFRMVCFKFIYGF